MLLNLVTCITSQSSFKLIDGSFKNQARVKLIVLISAERNPSTIMFIVIANRVLIAPQNYCSTDVHLV